MRRTLRRSCAACAKAKHGCDLQTPKCSRCVERNLNCIYANEPLSSLSSLAGRVILAGQSSQAANIPSRRSSHRARSNILPEQSDQLSLSPLSRAVGTQQTDPFDTYPHISLPRARVQGLIYHFLSKIVYQYYPWDTNPATNPFVTSWWHLALSDPALFHVSLQTASLDDELHAQKGFLHSEILMRDSVSLVRLKVQDPSQAIQDTTMNAVVTLAAIEHGKGNLSTSRMHIEGVKIMVKARGGISKIRSLNPLTARMVSWVAMLVTGTPQFQIQDETGLMDGLGPITGLEAIPLRTGQAPSVADFHIDPAVEEILTRARVIFRQFGTANLQDSSVELSISDRQDLASFIVHKLLLLPCPTNMETESAIFSEAIRYGISIYMFIIHGPTYYSHMSILKELVLQLKYHLTTMSSIAGCHNSLSTWLFSVGMVASIGTEESDWFVTQISALSIRLNLQNWEDVRAHLKDVLWLEGTFGIMFQQAWEQIFHYSTVQWADSVTTQSNLT